MVNSSSFSSSNKMAGLMSGLDTESLVKNMASTAQARIDKQNQKIQTLQWQQEAYRDTISSISKFEETFLSMSSETSIKAVAVINKHLTESSDDRVTASATSGANDTTYTIVKAKSATTAKISSQKPVTSYTSNGITLDFSKNDFEYTMKDGKKVYTLDSDGLKKPKEYSVEMTVNGTTRKVKFLGVPDSENMASKTFLEAVNKTFDDVLGEKEFAYSDTNGSKYTLSLEGTDPDVIDTFSLGYNSEAIGATNDSFNLASLSTVLSQCSFARELKADKDGSYAMTINGETLKFDKKATIGDMIKKVNDADLGVTMSFNSFSQGFTLEADDSGTAGSVEVSNNGGSNLASVIFMSNGADDLKSVGENGTLTLEVDGKEYTYTSAENEYTFDGTTINIENLGDFTADKTAGAEKNAPITITSKKDTESIKDTIVKFVDEYNKIVDELYKQMDTKPLKYEGTSYKPLTEAEKEEMSKEEIDDWNEAAKTGVLYQDRYLSMFSSNIRMAMSGTVVDGFSLSDLGIANKAMDWNDPKLYIDEDKLEAALATHGEEVTKFFTDAEDGLAAKLTKVVDKAVSTKESSYGYLTQVAGVEGTNSDKKNTIFSQISSANRLLDTLQERYEKEYQRYWDQFTRLEVYMANMQNQSSSLFGTTTGTQA